MQSLVPSLSLDNLIPSAIFFSFVYLSHGKKKTLPKWQNRTPPDLQKKDTSGLANLRPLRIGTVRTLPHLQKKDSSGWQNWDPSGLGPTRLEKIAFSGLLKFSTDTRPDTFSDALMM